MYVCTCVYGHMWLCLCTQACLCVCLCPQPRHQKGLRSRERLHALWVSGANCCTRWPPGCAMGSSRFTCLPCPAAAKSFPRRYTSIISNLFNLFPLTVDFFPLIKSRRCGRQRSSAMAVASGRALDTIHVTVFTVFLSLRRSQDYLLAPGGICHWKRWILKGKGLFKIIFFFY